MPRRPLTPGSVLSPRAADGRGAVFWVTPEALRGVTDPVPPDYGDTLN